MNSNFTDKQSEFGSSFDGREGHNDKGPTTPGISGGNITGSSENQIEKNRVENPHNTDLAELEKLVALERDEVRELSEACEQLDRAIENEMGQKLELSMLEVDCLIDGFTNFIGNLDGLLHKMRADNVIVATAIKDRDAFLTSHDSDCRELKAKMDAISEEMDSKFREITALKNAAEASYAAELKDLDDDIKATRSILCEVEKEIDEAKHQLADLDEKLVTSRRSCITF